MSEVTDPSLLAKLNDQSYSDEPSKPVTDPSLLAQLNSDSVAPQEQSAPANYSSLLKELMISYPKGAIKGFGQGFGDIGASIGNLGISGLEHLFGKKLPHIPHPSLQGESIGENIGKYVGETAAPYFIPGGIGLKAGKYFAKPIMKIAAGTGLGALEGAAQNEDNRGLGGILGALGGAIGSGAPLLSKEFKDLKSKNIAQDFLNREKNVSEKYKKTFKGIMSKADEFGINKYHSPIKADIKLLKKGGDADLVYSLEQYNKKPTASNAHEAQTELARMAAQVPRRAPKIERDAKKEALRVSESLRENIVSAFESGGMSEYGKKYLNARSGFKKDVVPYINSPSFKKLKSGKLRDSEFVNKILNEEDFLSTVGKNSRSLRYREKLHNALHNKPLMWASGVAAATILPYEVKKFLDMH